MKTCDVCGNDIPVAARRCPFCESLQSASGSAARSGASGTARGVVSTLYLKQDLPTVAEAVRQLVLSLTGLRGTRTRVVKVVHGYGSTGKGGALAPAVRRELRALLAKGWIRGFVPGEEYSEFGAGGRALLERYPSLRGSFRSDRENPGITMVEL
ncbi:MAG: hypothetical protein FIB01_13270 [Gemmatimonadetes bacterium]|nr:hypothetical protein [Gemmatimonadota bacterium]